MVTRLYTQPKDNGQQKSALFYDFVFNMTIDLNSTRHDKANKIRKIRPNACL